MLLAMNPQHKMCIHINICLMFVKNASLYGRCAEGDGAPCIEINVIERKRR